MKKSSRTSLLGTIVYIFFLFLVSTIGSHTFAYTDTQYASTFNPNPSVCTISSSNVLHLNIGDLAGGGILMPNTIYVLPAGTHTISANIQMADCSTLVADGDTPGYAILDFQGGSYIFSNGEHDFMIAGFDATHRMEIIGSTSPAGILLQDSEGAKISYTILSGFTSFAGIALSNTQDATLRYNLIYGNKDGINLQGLSLNNTISDNTISDNTQHGIRAQGGSDSQTISNNIIDANAGYGIFLDGASSCSLSTNTIRNHSNFSLGMYIKNANNNTFSNNTVSNNYIGVGLENADNNHFTNNTITSNSYRGLTLQLTSSGNSFVGGSVSSNSTTNIYLIDAHHNSFSSLSVQSSVVGIEIDNSNYNSFVGVQVASNGNGTLLSNASYNILTLNNNTNGIRISNNSNSNTITNTQILGQNNITLINGSNNIITGGVFSSASTTATSVTISLKNDQSNPTYSIAGAGLSGTYAGAMTSSPQTLSIDLSAGNGAKPIVVTYNNGNKQYDTITVGSSSGGGGGGGGGGGTTLPACVSSNLVCQNGIWVLTSGASCQGGNLGLACSTTGTTLPVGSIVGSPYSDEMNEAYLWSYAHSITTMNTIQKANMEGILIRAHMAKMISNFAISIAGLIPDTTQTCTFDDTANQSTEMKFYIKLSCQLGLMGQGITSFDPNGEVTRAQFGTILSRVIRGSTYNGGTPYYTAHLNALKSVSIMTQISNPSMKEIRGYVMIMMMRTYEGGFLNK